MEQINREILESIKTWMSNRREPSDQIDHYQSNIVIQPPNILRSLGFVDIHLSKFNMSPMKIAPSDEFNQLFKWTSRLLRLMQANKCCLEAIELMRLNYSKRLAYHHVQEAINFVQGALCYDVTFDATVNIANHVTIEDSRTPIQEIVGKLCICLFARSPVKIIAKANHYYTCLLTAFLVDMIHEAGVPAALIQLFVYDRRRDSTNFEDLSASNCGPASLSKVSKLSVVSICFHDSDTNLACKCILECYLREIYYSNMIILVEESTYERFIIDWRDNYERVITQNSDNNNNSWQIEVDLNSIDLKSAHRMAGNCINIIKFRSVDELCKLLSKLRKIPYLQIWTNQYLMAQEICTNRNYLDQCAEFWINHLPKNVLGRKFDDYLLKYFKDSLKQNMNATYSEIIHYYEDEILEVRKLQGAFMSTRVSESKRIECVLRIYLNLISKSKSTKQMNMSIWESVARMRRIQLALLEKKMSEMPGESRIETLLRPIGLAILVIRNESCIKSKHILIEFIFKNLLLGNGVILVCPQTILGLRFPVDLMKKSHLPFRILDSAKIIHLSDQVQNESSELLDELMPHNPSQQQQEKQQLDTSIDSGFNTSLIQQAKKEMKCPKNVYAVELKEAELTSDKVDAMILALGAKKKTIWYPDGALHSNQQASES